MKRLGNLALLGGLAFFGQAVLCPMGLAGQKAPTQIERYEDQVEDLGQQLDAARDALGIDIALRDQAKSEDRKKLDDEILQLKTLDIPKIGTKLAKVREQLADAQGAVIKDLMKQGTDHLTSEQNRRYKSYQLRIADLGDLKDQLKRDEKDLVKAQAELEKATSEDRADLQASIFSLQADIEAGRSEIESSEDTVVSMQDELIYLLQSTSQKAQAEPGRKIASQ